MASGFHALDIDVWSDANLGPLIAGLEGVAFVLSDNTTAEGRFVTFELESATRETAEEEITTFLDALASAPPAARAAWNAASRRELNIGANAPRAGSAHVALSPAVLRAAAAANATLIVTLYPPDYAPTV